MRWVAITKMMLNLVLAMVRSVIVQLTLHSSIGLINVIWRYSDGIRQDTMVIQRQTE